MIGFDVYLNLNFILSIDDDGSSSEADFDDDSCCSSSGGETESDSASDDSHADAELLFSQCHRVNFNF